MDRNRALRGVLLLTLSSAALRGIGMVYRIVLSERIGLEGMGLYELILTVYGLFSMLACAGLTITVSRLCAEGRERAAVRAACLYAAALGTVLCAGLYGSAEFLAGALLGDARAARALKWIAPSLPLMGMSAALRGAFLARGDLLRPTLAQLAEQVVRVGLVLALLFLWDVTDLSQACAVILFGATFAEGVSLLLCALLYRRVRSAGAAEAALPWGPLLRGVLPIWLGALLQCGMQTAENLLIPPLLQRGALSASQALAQYGLLSGMVLPILLFPAAFPAAVGTLLLPEMARERARGREERERALTRKALGAALGLSLLCAGFFLLFGEKLMLLLYGSESAGGLLLLLTPLLPLLSLESVADALLKGLGKQGATLALETLDALLRVLAILLLLPRLGMLGYVLVLYGSAVLCALTRLRLLFAAVGLERRALLLLLREPLTLLRRRA